VVSNESFATLDPQPGEAGSDSPTGSRPADSRLCRSPGPRPAQGQATRLPPIARYKNTNASRFTEIYYLA